MPDRAMSVVAVADLFGISGRRQELRAVLAGAERDAADSDDDYTAMFAAVELLEEQGPALGRPAADRLEGSRHHNMKELRSFGGYLRALFAFDPKRRAIVLFGGDERGDWTGWYERNIPMADDPYDEHLRNIENES